MTTIKAKGMEFKLLQNAAGYYISLHSEYCDDDFLNYLRKNLPEDINKIPRMIEFIEKMHEIYYQK